MARITAEKIKSFAQVFITMINDYGIDAATEKLLELGDPNEHNVKDIIKLKVLDEVCSFYSTTHEKLFNDKNRELIPAKFLAILLLDKYTELSQTSIAKLFGEHRTVVNKIVLHFKKTCNNEEVKQLQYVKHFTKKFIEKHNELNEKIADYKSKLKS